MRHGETSAARMRELLQYLERGGSLSIREAAESLGFGTTTVARYADALQSGGWAVWGRRAPCDSPRERKLRLSATWKFRTLLVGRDRVQTVSFCPATGQSERQTVMLCDAIPTDEALTAALHRILDTWTTEEKRSGLLGVIVEAGAVLPPVASLGLESAQIFDREELTRASLAKEYGEKIVLHVRYGENPQIRLFSGGAYMPELRPQTMLRQTWNVKSEARVRMLAEQIVRVLALLTPDVLVLESDGMRGDTVRESLQAALVAQGCSSDVPLPPLRVCVESMAEKELLDRLHLCLAKEILLKSDE